MPSYTRKVEIPGKSAQELYDKVATDIDRFLDKASLPVKMEIERDPGSKQVKVKSSMFSATLICGNATIEVAAQLSLLAAPFKSKLDEGIDKWLARTFQA